MKLSLAFLSSLTGYTILVHLGCMADNTRHIVPPKPSVEEEENVQVVVVDHGHQVQIQPKEPKGNIDGHTKEQLEELDEALHQHPDHLKENKFRKDPEKMERMKGRKRKKQRQQKNKGDHTGPIPSPKGRKKAGEKSQGRKGKKRMRRNVVSQDKLWHRGIVPYVINNTGQFYTEHDEGYYRYAMERVSSKTCIKFVPWNTSTRALYDLNHDGYMEFRRETEGWGFASLGNSGAPRQHCSCTGRENCIHELCHVLGFNHEQKEADRKDFIRINWEHIPSNYLNEYTETNDMANGSYAYDQTSAVHYALNALDYTVKPEMTLLDNDIRVTPDKYYTFLEIADVYNCRGRECSESSVTCVNDGYLTKVAGDSTCRCICPDGLTADSGCASVGGHVNNSPMPPGSYALPQPGEGCPDSTFQNGSLSHRFQWASQAGVYTMAGGIKEGRKSEQHFCVHQGGDGETEWPRGSYCIFQKNGACPPGFEAGTQQFLNDYRNFTPARANTTGSLPDGLYQGNTTLYYCCRDDSPSYAPVSLPNTQPLALLPSTWVCQRIQGMFEQMNDVFLNAQGTVMTYSSSPHPKDYVYSNPDVNMWQRFCVYRPANYSCGEVISLTSDNRQRTIISPGFPTSYTPNLECHWYIEGPENSTLTLEFADFDLEQTSNHKCLDTVEIRSYLYAQSGTRYCGEGLRRAFRTVNNRFHLIMRTNPSGSNRGFNATVRMHLEEELCYNPKDMGASYRGTVSYTDLDYQTCLTWTDPDLVTNRCRHFANNSLDLDSGLDSNYCRNPGDGTRPWCYIAALDCQRQYCDVCHLEPVYDVESDCASRIAADSDYCSDKQTARTTCAKSCASQLNMNPQPHYTQVTCSAPTAPSDAKAQTLSSSYLVGDQVTFSCKTPADSTWRTTITCLSDGTWTPLASSCMGCPDGWFAFRDSCYLTSAGSDTYYGAQATCHSLGAELAEMRDQSIMDFFYHMRDDGMDMWNGAKKAMNASQWTWNDNSTLQWNKWASTPNVNNTYVEYCGIARFSNEWTTKYCSSFAYYNCRLMYQEPPPADSLDPECKDIMPSACPHWAKGGYCIYSFPDYMAQNCPLTCRKCPERQVLNCADSNPSCPGWAASGECSANPAYMLPNCRGSCDTCLNTTVAACESGECGSHLCSNIQGNSVCTCKQGYHGDNCTSQFPCVDEDSTCADKISDNAIFCTQFPEQANFRCRKSCSIC